MGVSVTEDAVTGGVCRRRRPWLLLLYAFSVALRLVVVVADTHVFEPTRASEIKLTGARL
jgi:hypothetical protein